MASQADAGSSDAGWKETFQAIGQVINNLTPSTGFSEDSLKRFISDIQEKREKDREDTIKLAKLVAKNRNRKSIDLELIEHQNRQIMENFWKYINRKI